MTILMAIFIGSFVGTMLRYVCLTFWPWQTTYLTAVFTVNMIGAFLWASCLLLIPYRFGMGQ